MPIAKDDIAELIRHSLPDAEVFFEDLTGTQDHWRLVVVSGEFEDMRLLQQHKAVKDSLAAPLADGRIHALSLKTWTPGKWEEAGRPTG